MKKRCVAFAMDTERKPIYTFIVATSDRMERLGARNKTVQCSGSRGQAVAFPTTVLTHPQFSLAFYFGSLQRGYSWQTAGNKSSHFTPKTRAHEVQFQFKNKCVLATLGPGWKDDLVAEWRNVVFCETRVEAVLQTEAPTVFPGCWHM